MTSRSPSRGGPSSSPTSTCTPGRSSRSVTRDRAAAGAPSPRPCSDAPVLCTMQAWGRRSAQRRPSVTTELNDSAPGGYRGRFSVASAHLIRDTIARMNRERDTTVFLTTHNLEEANLLFFFNDMTPPEIYTPTNRPQAL